MAGQSLRLELLGGVDLRGIAPEQAERVLVQPKLVALLAYLAIAGAARPYQRRDQLIALLWPELDQAHARTALRKAVHLLRAAIGNEVILSRGDEEIALGEGLLACDAIEFPLHVDNIRLARAMELYRGDLMPGFHLTGCAEFEQWLDEQRNELRRQAAAAALALAQMFERESSLTIATKWARKATRFARDDERVLRRAVSLLDRAGDRAGALKLYEEFAARLKAEYSAEPSVETESLIRGLRTH